jgi:hypothetical protein
MWVIATVPMLTWSCGYATSYLGSYLLCDGRGQA